MKTDLICFKCKHFRPIEGGCEAFPDGIPDELTEGGVDTHDKPLFGQDNAILFEEGEPSLFID